MSKPLKDLSHAINRLLLLYVVVCCLGIAVSDVFLAWLMGDSPWVLGQIAKDGLLVSVTTILLGQLLHRHLEYFYRHYRLFHAIIEASDDAIFVKDIHGRYLMANQTMARNLNTSTTELIGKDDLELLPPEVACPIIQHDQTVINTGKSLTVEETLSHIRPQVYLTNKTPYINESDQIIGVVGIARNISEYHSLLEELRSQKEDLDALKLVTETSISTLNTERLINVLLQRIVDVMRVDSAVILLSDESKRLLVVGACIGMEMEVASEYPIPIGVGFAGTIARSMQPLYVEDTKTNPLLANTLIQQRGTRTLLGVPMKLHGSLVGVLHVGWREPHPKSERELRLLEITAERSCMAIINARLYEEAKRLSRRLQLQIDRMPTGLIIWNKDLKFTDWNPAAEEIFGYSKSEIIRQDYRLIGDQSNQLEELIRRALHGDMTAHREVQNRRKDGTWITCEWQNTPISNPDGEVIAIMSMVQDISDRKKAELQIHKLAFYDELTQLPNRTLFMETLQQLGRGQMQNFAILLLDIGNYQVVKYSLGHRIADLLLLAISERLCNCVDRNHILARVSSHEFAILFKDLKDPRQATRLAETIQSNLSQPIQLENKYEISPATSIGICLSNRPAQNPVEGMIDPVSSQPEDWFRAADTAMHAAKLRGRSQFAVFDLDMQEQAFKRLQMEADLRRALEQEQLHVYYQPIIDLTTEQLVGFEALVRWLHPRRGVIPPNEFIPIAEEAGWIGLVDLTVIRQACQQLAQWRKQIPQAENLKVSVNLSIQELAQDNLLMLLEESLRQSQLPPEHLKIEITETCLMNNADSDKRILEQMKELGVELLIDDFGTGQSSLARLHQLPIDTLKIDQYFVKQMQVHSESLEIVKTIINLAHGLNMDVIAEGIEHVSQFHYLRELGCDYGQGFLIARPLSVNQAEELLFNLGKAESNNIKPDLFTLFPQ